MLRGSSLRKPLAPRVPSLLPSHRKSQNVKCLGVATEVKITILGIDSYIYYTVDSLGSCDCFEEVFLRIEFSYILT